MEAIISLLAFTGFQFRLYHIIYTYFTHIKVLAQ